MMRRRPAPKDARERAQRAGAYADEVYAYRMGVTRQLERCDQSGGYDTRGYKQALADDAREVIAADEVATDAFLEAGQERLAKKHIARAKKYREVFLPAYQRWADTAEGNESLAYLLDRETRSISIGLEREVPIAERWQSGLRALTRNAHARMFTSRAMMFTGPTGSYRYVAFDGTTPVSAIQIMSRDGREGIITNVYTAPTHRRHGWATRLLDIARRRFRVLEHSTDLSPAGAAWAERQRL